MIMALKRHLSCNFILIGRFCIRKGSLISDITCWSLTCTELCELTGSTKDIFELALTNSTLIISKDKYTSPTTPFKNIRLYMENMKLLTNYPTQISRDI